MLELYGLQESGRRTITVNGLEALEITADQRPQEGQAQQVVTRTLSCLIRKGNAVYHLLGASSAVDFDEFEPQFRASMQSFRELNDPEKIGRQPERIRIKTVNVAGTLQQVLASFGVPAKRMEELAILNGMELKDRLGAGMLIKVPGR